MASKTTNPRKKTTNDPALTPGAQDTANGKEVVNGKPDEAIRALAYMKWHAAGKPAGDGLCYWLEAEREVRQSTGVHS